MINSTVRNLFSLFAALEIYFTYSESKTGRTEIPSLQGP